MSALGTSLAREMVAAIAQEVAHDPDLARSLAEALAPYLPQQGGGWLTPANAVTYLDLGSPDALDRLVREGLPCSQPSGPEEAAVTSTEKRLIAG